MRLEPAVTAPGLLDTAVSHAVTAVPIFPPDATAAQAREALARQRFESAVDVVLCEHRPEGGLRLRGLVPIERLLAEPGATPLVEIADLDPPVVGPGLDQEAAAWRAVRQGESSLAVVASDGEFLGLVPPTRMLAVLLQEHDEDLARLGGYLKATSLARSAAEERILRRFLHRLPWLLVGLLGAMATVSLVGSFEEHLQRTVALAFFVPAIVYMAAAVGTQTETVVIRALAVGVSMRRVVRREAVTGVLVGATLAAAIFPFSLVYAGLDVAASVSVALLVASSFASLVALALPWVLLRLGRDPAFGTGPVATVLEDLASLSLFFGVSLLLVGG